MWFSCSPYRDHCRGCHGTALSSTSCRMLTTSIWRMRRAWLVLRWSDRFPKVEPRYDDKDQMQLRRQSYEQGRAGSLSSRSARFSSIGRASKFVCFVLRRVIVKYKSHHWQNGGAALGTGAMQVAGFRRRSARRSASASGVVLSQHFKSVRSACDFDKREEFCRASQYQERLSFQVQAAPRDGRRTRDRVLRSRSPNTGSGFAWVAQCSPSAEGHQTHKDSRPGRSLECMEWWFALGLKTVVTGDLRRLEIQRSDSRAGRATNVSRWCSRMFGWRTMEQSSRQFLSELCLIQMMSVLVASACSIQWRLVCAESLRNPADHHSRAVGWRKSPLKGSFHYSSLCFKSPISSNRQEVSSCGESGLPETSAAFSLTKKKVSFKIGDSSSIHCNMVRERWVAPISSCVDLSWWSNMATVEQLAQALAEVRHNRSTASRSPDDRASGFARDEHVSNLLGSRHGVECPVVHLWVCGSPGESRIDGESINWVGWETQPRAHSWDETWCETAVLSPCEHSSWKGADSCPKRWETSRYQGSDTNQDRVPAWRSRTTHRNAHGNHATCLGFSQRTFRTNWLGGNDESKSTKVKVSRPFQTAWRSQSWHLTLLSQFEMWSDWQQDQLVESIEWCDRTCRSFLLNLAESLTRMVEWSRMDVDAVGKGPGKGCFVCGRRGHAATDC